MDIIRAVELAKKGDNNGITYLYEKTYQRAYYIALKYLKNEYNAQDVLQESYIKAFQSLEQLEGASKFESWFGRIVATRSMNELKKDNPMLFSMTENEDEGDISDIFEDDRIDTCPELAMDQKETARLIQEMMSGLSDEQRICITMFYMDEMSVKEIAETLGVSENTVKSRLNYGRNKIKDKVLELEKKGTKLYGLLPMVFFIALFKKDALACQAAVPPVSSVLSGVGVAKGSGAATASASLNTTGATATTGAAKAGVTIGGITLSVKSIIAIIVAAVIAVGGVAINSMFSHKKIVTQKFIYIDFNGIGTYTGFVWGKYPVLDQDSGKIVEKNDISYVLEPITEPYFERGAGLREYSLEETPHLYAKSYDNVIYIATEKGDDNQYSCLYYIDPTNKLVDVYSSQFDNYDDASWCSVEVVPAAQVYYGLQKNGFDYSDWIDITTFVDRSMPSVEKYFKFSKKHNAEWVELIKATNESLPELPKKQTEETVIVPETFVDNSEPEEQEKVEQETESSVVTETNKWAGHYEMSPDIDAWLKIDIDEKGLGSYEYGDLHGYILHNSDTPDKFALHNYDVPGGYVLTLSDNGDGTYNAKMIETKSPYMEEDWTLIKK